MRHIILALTLLAMTARCATVQQGPLQRIHVDSEPAGAAVKKEAGCGGPRMEPTRTPVTVWVSRRATTCRLSVWRQGYDREIVPLTRKLSDAVDGNFDPLNSAETLNEGLFLGLFSAAGLGIDALSGAMWEQVPSKLFVTLSRTPESEILDDSSEAEPEPAHRDESSPEPNQPRSGGRP